MKRPLTAVLAAAIAIAAFPGATTAAPPIPGVEDQDAALGEGTVAIGSASTLTQTFASHHHRGLLTYVNLYCSSPESGTVNVTLSVAGVSTTGTCSSTPQWVSFVFADPATVAYPGVYTLTIQADGPAVFGASAANYAEGAAALDGQPIPGVSDIAFETFTQGLPQTLITWDPASVDPPSGSPVKMALFVTLPVMWYWHVGPGYYEATITLDSYPPEFQPTSIGCTTPFFDTLPCTLDPLGPWTVQAGGAVDMYLLFLLTGTITTPGTTGVLQASAHTCMTWTYLGRPRTDCTPGTGEIYVGQTPPPATPPPTAMATPDRPASDSGAPWGVLISAALAGLASLFFVERLCLRARA